MEIFTKKINEELKKIADEQFASWDNFINRIRIYDLTREIRSESTCILDKGTQPRLNNNSAGKQTRFITNVIDNLYTNIGTHIDFPGHLGLNNKRLISLYDPKYFVGPAIVIDISDKTKVLMNYLNDEGLIDFEKLAPTDTHQPDRLQKYFELIDELEITKDEFENKLKEAQLELGENYFILFHTGLDKFWQYRSFEKAWQYSYFINPYFSDSLVSFLVSKKIKGIGIDCLQIENPIINIPENDVFFSAERTELIRRLTIIMANLVHIRLLKNEIILIENLTNLKTILNKKVLFMCFPPKFGIENKEKDRRTDDNSFVRAIAFEHTV